MKSDKMHQQDWNSNRPYEARKASDDNFTSGSSQQRQFMQKMYQGAQHPAIGMQLDLDPGVERDAYGQPLSPTHLISTAKGFAGENGKNGSEDGKGGHSFSFQAQGATGGHHAQTAHQANASENMKNSQNSSNFDGGGGAHGGASGKNGAGFQFENQQTALLGAPKLSGLSTYEYSVDGLLRYYTAEMKPEHVDTESLERCQVIFHREVGFGSKSQIQGTDSPNEGDKNAKGDDWKSQTGGGSSINRKNIQIETDKHIFSLAENDSLNRGQKSAIHPPFGLTGGRTGDGAAGAADVKQSTGQAGAAQREETLDELLKSHFKTQEGREAARHLMEVQINLPLQTLVEQVEVKLSQAPERQELFRKYLRISGVTRSSVLRREALERDSQITQDIQMTCLSPEAKRGDEEAEKQRLRAQKFYKISSGFLDTQKTTAEFNLRGAVCHQLNLVFEFDMAKVRELIVQCKKIQAERIGKNLGDLDPGRPDALGTFGQPKNEAGGPNGKVEGQTKPVDSVTGLRDQLNLISKTNSQFLSSSYGDEMYYNIIGDGSEIDDLEDQEVQGIARRQQAARQMAQGNAQTTEQNKDSSGADAASGGQPSSSQPPGGTNHISPDDIRIIIDDEDHQTQRDADGHLQNAKAAATGGQDATNKGLADQNDEKAEANQKVLTKTDNAANSHNFFNYTEAEKKLLEERNLFEGTNQAVWAKRLLTLVLQAIKITGLNMSKIPAITNLSHLMNTSFYLKKDRVHLEDALEVDFMLGTLMISSKRNTQAIEVLRNKVQASYLRQIEYNIARMQGKSGTGGPGGESDQVPQPAGDSAEFQRSILSNDSKQNLKVQIKKLFTRCAIIELMSAESMCSKPQLSDKLQALLRMTQLCRGQLTQPLSFGKQIFLADDEYTTMTKILPYMLKFTIQCIENNYHCSREIVIISALRNIQFVLETQGCSLDSAMIFILKAIFKNYPDKLKQEKILKRQRELRAQLQHQAAQQEHALINIQGASTTNLNGAGLGQTGHHKTLLSESRRAGGIQGTSSANELRHRESLQRPGLNSTKEMQQLLGYQFNQNSARGSQNLVDNMRLDEGKQLQRELNKAFRLDQMTMIESIFSLSWIPLRDEPAMKKEPNSGFEKTLMTLFNSLLESYVSVLSSISSHILHQIFYEVIVPCLIGQPFEEDRLRHDSMDKEERQILGEFAVEVKIFAVKIAEKIITICQGDLIMSRPLLDTLVKATSAQSYKKQLEMTGAGEQYRNLMKNLWASIRSKVFTNYSMKGFKQLIEWLVAKMATLAQNCNILDGKSSASEIAMLELSDDNLQQLSQYLEIITFISVGRRNSHEEANSLIKIKHEYCMDLYLLLNPLLFWLDFSVEREERLNLFKHVYRAIKDVLANLPPKKVDIDILQIIVPILERTSDYLRQSSPTQSMLKFLDIVLQDIIDGRFCQAGNPTNLQYFFLDQLTSIVGYISYSLYEEIFPVFDKLLQLCRDVMTEDTLRRCIVALVDKYTMKCKGHKQTTSQFMKALLDSNTSAIMTRGDGGKRMGNTGDQMGATGAVSSGQFIDIFDEEIDIMQNPDKQPGGRRGNAGGQGRGPGGRRAKKNTFFDVMLDKCFFSNDDGQAKAAADVLLGDHSRGQYGDDSCIRRDDTAQFRSPQDLHEIFTGKLQFFIDSLSLLGERHVEQFHALISNRKFKTTLFNLLEAGETNIRLKCHEILEIVSAYFIQVCPSKSVYQVALPPGVERPGGNRGRLQDRGQSQQGIDTELMEVDLISHDRLYIAQLIIQCVRKSFERTNGEDSYLQFNSLILLDYLFQNVLPVANFQNEQIKQRQNSENQRLHNLEIGRAMQIQNMRGDGNEMDDSQLEDGSSGGEGTGGQSRQARIRRENAQAQARQRLVEERIPNAYYLGELDEALDVETLEITEDTPELEVTDARYTAMRLKLVFKLWPYVQEALNSPWSNIRSICYGLICSMLKIDIRDCQKYLPHQHMALARMTEERRALGGSEGIDFSEEERNKILMTDLLDKQQTESNKFYLKLRQSVIPMMINLLSSKESESKAGGLNILGSICGLSYDFSKIKITRNLEFFKRNSEFISLPIWQHVFELQDDWDITIKEASIVLIQLCAPREAIKYFNKCKTEKESQKFQVMLNKMARSGGAQGGHGSLSNLSSARQNSLYNHINSKGSLNGLRRPANEARACDLAGGDSSNRRIDYKNVDFGYKDKHIPNIPGLINEFGKIDIATFLNDNQDMMHLNVEEEGTFEPTGLGSGGLGSNATGSSQPGFKSLGAGLQKGPTGSGQIPENAHSNRLLPGGADHTLEGNQQLALDLGKIQESKDDPQRRGFLAEAEGALHQSSMSQTSNLFGANYQQNQLNQQILQQSLQQNQNLVQAMQGQNPGASQSAIFHEPFDFFVDAYSDDQIQEIISIFRNDFKPPKNLWIEKAAEYSQYNAPDLYQDIYSSAIEQFNQQQMLLQQKQQQELQEQVSSGSSLSGAAAQEGHRLSAGDNIILDVGPSVPSQSNSEAKAPEASQPQPKESSELESKGPGIKGKSPGIGEKESAPQQMPGKESDQNKEELLLEPAEPKESKDGQGEGDPNDGAQNRQDGASINQNKSNGGASSSIPHQQAAPPPADGGAALSSPKATTNDAGTSGDNGSASYQRFDPSRDLNIFEQINFDEMNISDADINSCGFKQDGINSSTSDVVENYDSEQPSYPQQQNQQIDHIGGSGGSEQRGKSGSDGCEERVSQALNGSDPELEVDDAHIKIVSQQHDMQVPNLDKSGASEDQGEGGVEKSQKGLRTEIEAAHELALDLGLMDERHGVDMQLFQQDSNSTSQQFASGSKSSHVLEDSAGKRGYQDAQNFVPVEMGRLFDVADSSGAGSQPPSAHDKPDRYHLLGKLATDLPVIESRSDEVSHSSASAAEAAASADREPASKTVQTNKQQKVSTTQVTRRPVGENRVPPGPVSTVEQNTSGRALLYAQKSQQRSTIRGQEPSDEMDATGTSHPLSGMDESGERAFVDIQESGFDESGAGIGAKAGSRHHELSLPADEEDEQEQLLAHFEKQNSLTLQMIQMDQKSGLASHAQGYSKQTAMAKQNAAGWSLYGPTQAPHQQSQPESQRSKKAAAKARTQASGKSQQVGGGGKGTIFKAGPPQGYREDSAASGQGLEDYQLLTNLRLEEAELLNFKQKMQARTQPIDVNDLRGLEREMLLINEHSADRNAQFTQGSQGSAPQQPGIASSGANTIQRVVAQDAQDAQQANHKMLRPASTSNSSPDIKSKLYKIATAKQSQSRKSKEKSKTKKQNITTKYQSEIDSARQNFVQAHIHISAPAPMSLGNFSHRVQPTAGAPGPSNQLVAGSGPKQTGVAMPNQQHSAPGAKKQILKNLRHIKTNNEDYIIMQNISSQMNGKLTDSLYNPLQGNPLNLTTSGLNTTKNNKIDKSFENLMSAFALRSGPAKSGQGTSLGCIKTNTHPSGKQHSHDSSQGLPGAHPPNSANGKSAQGAGKSKMSRQAAAMVQRSNVDSGNRNQSAASGNKKTMSSSPQRQQVYEPHLYLSKLLSNPAAGGTLSSMQLSAIAKQMAKQAKHSGQGHKGTSGQVKPAKSSKSGGAAASTTAQNTSAGSQNQHTSNKRQQEKLKDLNFFIKTIEKFSKKNAVVAEKTPQYAALLKGADMQQPRQNRPSQPQVIAGMDQGTFGAKNAPQGTGTNKAMRSRGSTGSDPQTPKDVLVNLGDQMLGMSQGRSQSNQNSGMSHGRKANSMNKINSLLGQTLGMQTVNLKNQGPSMQYNSGSLGPLANQQTQQMYEQMKNQNIEDPGLFKQVQQSSNPVAKYVQNALKKEGLNMSQLNAILSQSTQKQGPLGTDQGQSNAAPSQQYTSIRNKAGLLNQLSGGGGKTYNTSGTRSRGRSGQPGGGSEAANKGITVTQGSRPSQKHNGLSKSSKSNKSQQQNGSYSPPHSSNQLIDGLGIDKQQLLGKKLNINTNMQAQMHNMVSSHRDAGSVDSKGRSCSTNKSGRGSHNLKAKNHKKKKLSFNLNQHPPQLNNLLSMNYSQTQKIDMKEINRQLNQISNPRGLSSTQNKAQKYDSILLTNYKQTDKNGGKTTIKTTREGPMVTTAPEKRDRSAGSNHSKNQITGLQMLVKHNYVQKQNAKTCLFQY